MHTEKSLGGWKWDNRQRIILYTFFAGCFWLCCLLAKYKFAGITAIILFLAWLVQVIKENLGFAIKYSFVLFSSLVAIISMCIREFTNTYMYEVKTVSSYIGALPLYIFSFWILLATLIVCDIRFSKRKLISQHLCNNEKNRNIVIALSLIITFIALICWAKIFTRPAFILGIDRFQYKLLFKRTLLEKVFETLYIHLIIFPALAIKKGYRKLGVSSIIILFCYSLWTGNKFSNLAAMISVIIFVYYEEIVQLTRTYKHTVLIVSCISILLLVVIAGCLQTYFLSKGSSDMLGYVFRRLSSNSDLWWKTYQITGGEIHPSEFIEDIRAIFNGKDTVLENLGANNGGYRIMYLCSSREFVNNYLSRGIRWGECGFASVYYLFGGLGCGMWAIFCGIILSLTTNQLIWEIEEGRFLRAFLLVRFYTIERVMLTYFVFSNMIDTWSLISYSVLLITMKNKFLIKLRGKPLFEV